MTKAPSRTTPQVKFNTTLLGPRGKDRLPYQDDVAFHVSYWTGPLAQIEMWASWIDVGRGASAPHDVIARLLYGGSPVFGYVLKPGGIPGDGYGRNVAIESLDSLLGTGGGVSRRSSCAPRPGCSATR